MKKGPQGPFLLVGRSPSGHEDQVDDEGQQEAVDGNGMKSRRRISARKVLMAIMATTRR